LETSASAESVWEYYRLVRSIILKSGQIRVNHVVLKISSGFGIGLILLSIVSGNSSFSSICICLSDCIL